MNIEELLSFIREELKDCQGYQFIDRTIIDLRKAMTERERFDPIKFKEWFIDRGVVYRNSPLAFLVKCGISDLEKGAFDKEVFNGFDYCSFFEAMRSKGIEKTGRDDLCISIYLDYIGKNRLMSIEDIQEWADNALEYVSTHTKKASEFRVLFEKSITMKRLRLPYKELDKEVTKGFEDINSVLHDLNEKQIQMAKRYKESETKNEKESEINNQTTQTC